MSAKENKRFRKSVMKAKRKRDSEWEWQAVKMINEALESDGPELTKKIRVFILEELMRRMKA